MKYLLALLCFSCIVGTTDAAQPVSFEREVLPVLEKRCNKCHYPEQQRGGLDLTRIDTIRRGGDELGAAIVPGKPDASPLLQVLTGAKEPRMPENGEPLAPAEIELLRRWIAEGAKDDSTQFPADDVAFFEREIRPVLSARCFKCHAGDEAEHGLQLTSRQAILAGGVRGPAAVAGKPEASLMLRAIRHDGELKMPRGGDKLSDVQAAAFESWIAKGLPWPSNERVLVREKQFTISEADRNHWAFRPLPKELPAAWNIDAALRPHHERLGLTPAAEADRHRLLRRVSYDLIGYPPTPEEIAAFVDDDSPEAFERVVNRLLDSPHFGRRWGRHWLDYTRNGANAQSNRGPAFDTRRYDSWVARCLNEDRPWDWFVRAHVAGDLMPSYEGQDYSIDQALAAAVPLNGPRTFEEITTQTFVLMDKLDEGVEFLGRSVLGISLECARCHDHKFDPIAQRDYYALLGFFQSSWFAPVPTSTKTRDEAVAAVERYRNLVSEQARHNGFIRQASLMLNVGGGGRVKQWQATRLPILAPVDRRLRELEIAVLEGEMRDAESRGETQLAADFRTALAERHTSLKNHRSPDYLAGGGAILGKYNYFIGGHKTEVGLIKRATAVKLPEVVRELEVQLGYWEEERGRWIERSRFGGYAKSDPEVVELAKADDRILEIANELAVNAAQCWVVPTTDLMYVRCEGGLRRAEDLGPLDAAAKSAGLQFNSNNADRVWLHPFYIGDTRLLLRGDVLYPDKIVPRGVPQFFGALPTPLHGSGRLQLAQWLTAPDSLQAALAARTVVNRAWQHLFGEALCRTPKELGRLGEQPEMPELIDGLAVRFVADGWSLKSVVREIVLSRAYRRSAIVEDGEFSRDADNRYFARQSVRRLEYEPILNAVASLRTGRRYEDPVERDAAVPGVAEYAKYFDAPSVYDLLDRRTASISATQALFLMNNPSAANNLAGELVNRLGVDSQTELGESLETLYMHIVQRRPTVADRELARKFAERRRSQTGKKNTRDEIREFVGLLLCGNELLYIE